MRFAFVLPRLTLSIFMSRSRAAIRRRPLVDPSSRRPARFAVGARPHDVAGRWTLDIPADRLTLERMAPTNSFQISSGDARRVADWDWSRGVRGCESVLASQSEEASGVVHYAVEVVGSGPIQGRVGDVIEVSGVLAALGFGVVAAICVLLHEFSISTERREILAVVVYVLATVGSLVLMVEA